MEQKALQNLLIALLRSELTEAEFKISVKTLTPEAADALFLLSKRHDVAHAVAPALHKCGIKLDGQAAEKFHKEELLSVFRNENIGYSYERLCAAFDKACISYVPLKGSVLRDYYPQQSLRTSCDIDILVKEDSLAAAVAALEECGFSCGERGYHDISLFSPNGVHIELHFSLSENMDKADEILSDAWSHASNAEGCRYTLSDELFVFYIFAHAAYHFLSGGCGLRTLMDIYIMRHKMGCDYLKSAELLKSADLYKFAAELSELAEVCFSYGFEDEFCDSLLDYIVSGGVYGSEQNRVAVSKSVDGSTAEYILKRLFLPYKLMAIEYPILERCAILLPFCWVARWFRTLFGGNAGRAVKELKAASDMTAEQAENAARLRERLGF